MTTSARSLLHVGDQNYASEQLELQVAIPRKHVGKHARSPPYILAERLHVLWFMEYFQLPRRRVSEYFGIARSTLYRT